MTASILDRLIKDIENRIDTADLTPERTNSGIVVYL